MLFRSEFIADLSVLGLEPAAVLDVPADTQSQTNNNQAIPSPIESIHQTSLTVVGVHSDFENKANNNLPISSPNESIHQAVSTETQPIIIGVYPISEVHQSDELAVPQSATESKGSGTKKNTDCWYTPPDIVELVLETLGWIDLDPCADNHKHLPAKAHYTEADDGLTREWPGKVFMNPPYSSPSKWVAKLQAEFDSGRVTEAIALVPAATDTKWLSPLLNTQAICFWKGRIKFLDTDYQPKLPARQSHVLVYWGAESAKFKQGFEKRGTVFIPEVAPCPESTIDALEPGDRLNTNPAIPSPIQGIHQALSIQGGNGLVYTFWKGESLVNHYRYKVKLNGKWKVRSVYIPVGKLPKVREAITNNLGVATIVVEILKKHL